MSKPFFVKKFANHSQKGINKIIGGVERSETAVFNINNRKVPISPVFIFFTISYMANRTLKTVSTYQDAPLFDKTVSGLLNQ